MLNSGCIWLNSKAAAAANADIVSFLHYAEHICQIHNHFGIYKGGIQQKKSGEKCQYTLRHCTKEQIVQQSVKRLKYAYEPIQLETATRPPEEALNAYCATQRYA